MLECKDYSLNDLRVYLHTNGKTNTDKKLERYDIQYSIEPNPVRRRNPIYHIEKIGDPFRLYCVFDLGFPPQLEFPKFRDVIVYLLNDPDFNWRPMEMMEEYLRKHHHGASRQTIATYIKRLEGLGYVCGKGDFVYYKVYKHYGIQKHELITREEYAAAWRVYWNCRDNGWDSFAAFRSMYNSIGGVPRKQARIIQNAFYGTEIDELNKYACESFLAEYDDLK